jgi:chromosome partitioning protein
MTMPSRPFISWTAEELKRYFEENFNERQALDSLLVELSYRRTRAANELKNAVQASLLALGTPERTVSQISRPRSDSRYSCFLSYARVDQKIAKNFQTLIESSGLPSWIDLEGLSPGAEWEPALRRALVQSDCVVILATERIPGTFVEQEVAMAMDMRKPIIALGLDDFITSEHALAMKLRRYQYIDYRHRNDATDAELLKTIRLYHLAPVMAIYSVKGGVGKTTLCAHMASYLFKRQDLSVLIIDLDPQANASTLLIRPQLQPVGMIGTARRRVDILEGLSRSGRTTHGLLLECRKAGAFSDDGLGIEQFIHNLDNSPIDVRFDIVAGDRRLAQNTTTDLSDQERQAIREGFGRFVQRCRKRYDCIMIDMNPSVSHLTLLGLSATTDIISPIKPDLYSIQSIDLLNEIASEHEEIGAGLGKVLVLNQPGIDPSGSVRSEIASSLLSDRLLDAELAESKEFQARVAPNLQEGLAFLPAYGNWGINPSPARKSLQNVVRAIAQKTGLRLKR